MPRIKVLTVQFDVTKLDQVALDNLRQALEVQGEDVVDAYDNCSDSQLLNSSIKEIDYEDTH